MSNNKPYTIEELDQQKVWADEFETWWENEGQYHRAGGTEYCKTFAWWAWLNREQARQADVDQLIKALEISAVANFISDACSGVKELKDLADENRIRINGLKLELKEKNKRIVELEERINRTIKALESDLKYVEGDFRGNHEFLKLAMIRCFKEDIDILAGDK